MFPPVKRGLMVVIVASVVGLASACGTSTGVSPPGSADLSNGQTLFKANCGGCHTLAAAGTKGTIGPDLDAAYREPAAEGWERTSFEALVREQIESGAPYAQPAPMPSNLVTGQDARD